MDQEIERDQEMCHCGILIRDTELPCGWSVHRSKEPESLGRLFYVSGLKFPSNLTNSNIILLVLLWHTAFWQLEIRNARVFSLQLKTTLRGICRKMFFPSCRWISDKPCQVSPERPHYAASTGIIPPPPEFSAVCGFLKSRGRITWCRQNAIHVFYQWTSARAFRWIRSSGINCFRLQQIRRQFPATDIIPM